MRNTYIGFIEQKNCKICPKPAKRSDYCWTHYMRLIKHGDPHKTFKPWGVKKPKGMTSA